MTAYELAEKDLRKAKVSLANALKKHNVSATEIENLETCVKLRTEILERVREDRQ